MESAPEKNIIIEETIEETMEDWEDKVELTPGHYLSLDGTPYYAYTCGKCSKPLFSCMSSCDTCYPSKKKYQDEDIPMSPPKLEVSISYYTENGVKKWHYPCGVCDRGMPNAFSFCCCTICKKRTFGHCLCK